MADHPGINARSIMRFRSGVAEEIVDELTVEEPLDIRIGKRSVAITMRTPGRDADLAKGFLFTEGILAARTWSAAESRTQPGQVRCQTVKANVVSLELPATRPVDWQRLERHSYTSSSCGVCGKTSLDQVYTAVPFPESSRCWTVKPEVLQALPDKLRAAQKLFARTGSIHAVGLFTPAGELLHVAEDVGRHNALDKLIGYYYNQDALPLEEHVLLLSGRASFELLQKAAMAGIQLVAAVGAPSSLAVDLAEELGVTLCGFVCVRGFNCYANSQRLAIA